MAGEKVLIIEDDTTLLRGLKDNFESKGYLVTTAVDGEEGLVLLRTVWNPGSRLHRKFIGGRNPGHFEVGQDDERCAGGRRQYRQSTSSVLGLRKARIEDCSSL